MNRIKLNAVLAGIPIVGASIITGIAQAEEVATNTLTTSEENSATVWEKTKEGSEEAWAKTKEVAGNAWDGTKEGSAKAWDKTKSTVQGWQETEPESETDSNQETPAHSQQPQAPQRAFNVLIERSIVPIRGEFRGLLAVHRSLNVCT